MAKESLGYVELEWNCPFCGGKNTGTATKCEQCGAPQPADVEFKQKAQEELIEDEELLAKASAGPDIHCAYCGTRNAGDAAICRQCGAELAEGSSREAGKVIGHHRHEKAPDVICAFCQTENPANASNCRNCGASLAEEPEPQKTPSPVKRPRNPLIYVAIAVIGLIILMFLFFALRTEEHSARVEGVEWTRTIMLQAMGPVSKQAFFEDIPDEAALGSCRQELHHTQDNPDPNGVKVCGTPYTVDTGTGLGEVVQDCVYEVYADYCEYTVQEWQNVDSVTLSGDDLSVAWPEFALQSGQREGSRDEDYVIIFTLDGEQAEYRTDDARIFQLAEPGSQWTVDVNSFGNITSITPAE